MTQLPAQLRPRRLVAAVLLTLFATLGASACDSSDAAERGPSAGPGKNARIEHVDAQRFDALAKEKNGIFLDVRTPGEVAAAHIAGASVIDIGDPQFRRKVALLPKDRPIFVYCATGSRSRSAVNLMKGLGFAELYDLKGGILGWKRAGLPLQQGQLGGSSKPALAPADFDAQIGAAPLVLVSYETAWCAPCRKLAPIVDEVTRAWDGKLELVRVDVDASDALATREKVEGVPVLVVYRDGKASWRHDGEISREALEAKLRELAPPTASAPASAAP